MPIPISEERNVCHMSHTNQWIKMFIHYLCGCLPKLCMQHCIVFPVIFLLDPSGPGQCQHTIGKENISTGFNALGLKKNSLIKPIFDKVWVPVLIRGFGAIRDFWTYLDSFLLGRITAMREMGLIQNLHASTFSLKCVTHVSDGAMLKPLSLTQMVGIFYIWIGGVTLACCCLFIEMLRGRWIIPKDTHCTARTWHFVTYCLTKRIRMLILFTLQMLFVSDWFGTPNLGSLFLVASHWPCSLSLGPFSNHRKGTYPKIGLVTRLG